MTNLKLFIGEHSVSVRQVKRNLYVPTVLWDEWMDPIYTPLALTASLVADRFPRDSWMVTSILSDPYGKPRNGSHGRKVALDIAIISDFPRLLRKDGKSTAMDQRPIPLTFMAQQEWPTSIFAEGDHFHIQRNDESGKPIPKGIFTAKGFRPNTYKDDSVRMSVPRGDYYQVMPSGEFILRRNVEIFPYLKSLMGSMEFSDYD